LITAGYVLIGLLLLMLPDLAQAAADRTGPEAVDIGREAVFIIITASLVHLVSKRGIRLVADEAAARASSRRNELVMREALEAVPGAVILLARVGPDMAIVYVNRAGVALLGTAGGADALRGRSLFGICPLDDESLDAIHEATAHGRTWTGDRSFLTDDNRTVPVALTLTPLPGEGETRLLLAASDRTAARRADRDRERLQLELDSLVGGAPIGFVTVGPDGLVQAWNPAATRILGWPASEVIGHRPPADLGVVLGDMLAGAISRPIGRDPVPPSDAVLRRKSGEVAHVRVTALTAYGHANDYLGFVAMLEDVTEQRRAADARREAEARLVAVVDASPVALVLLEPGGRVVLWTGAAERVFGWTAGEAVGRVFPPVPEPGVPQFLARLARVVAGEMVDGERFTYVASDGHLLPGRVWSAPIRAADGELIGIMGSFQPDPAPPPVPGSQ
jgi:PAS domain S-box-containing protein